MKLRLSCLLPLIIASSTEGHNDNDDSSRRRRCATKSPDPDASARLSADIQSRKLLLSTAIQKIVIPTHFVIFKPSNAPSEMPQTFVNAQMQVLNEGYSQTPFEFKLASVQYVVNKTYYSSMAEPNDSNVGALYKQGGTKTLMVYWGNKNIGKSFTRFPTLLHVGDADFAADVIFMDISTIPGGSSNCCHLRKTLVHEVGHWLGLYHTFEGESCAANNPGDYISDTPQQANKTDNECPLHRDSCPGLAGLDPTIYNFMDYSSDEDCLNEFTSGQIERMYIVWSLYRQNDETCNSNHILFKIEINLDVFASEVSWQLSGDNNLFINKIEKQFDN